VRLILILFLLVFLVLHSAFQYLDYAFASLLVIGLLVEHTSLNNGVVYALFEAGSFHYLLLNASFGD